MWRMANVGFELRPGRVKTWLLGWVAELFFSQAPSGMAGGTMAWGKKRVLSPFIPAGRLVRCATGLSRSGGEGQ